MSDVWVGNTLLREGTLSVEGSFADFRYQFESFGSRPLEWFGSPVVAVPVQWELRLVGGTTYSVELVDPAAARASFRVPSGLDLDQITGLTITEWRLKVPIVVKVTVTTEAGMKVDLPDGTVVRYLGAESSDDSTSTLRFSVQEPRLWGQEATVDDVPVGIGAGPGWLRASNTDEGFNLEWDSATPPQSAQVFVRLIRWLAVETEIQVASSS